MTLIQFCILVEDRDHTCSKFYLTSGGLSTVVILPLHTLHRLYKESKSRSGTYVTGSFIMLSWQFFLTQKGAQDTAAETITISAPT